MQAQPGQLNAPRDRARVIHFSNQTRSTGSGLGIAPPMQKYRVTCPHCDASLLVTEDLLGQSGNCPACKAEFLLPNEESFTVAATEMPPPRSVPAPPTTPPAAPPVPLIGAAGISAAAGRASGPKLVKIENRSAVRLLSTLLRGIALLQILVACIVLIVLLVLALRVPPPPYVILEVVGGALAIGLSAVFTLAYAELLSIFVAQEEMLRHIVNQLRSRE